MYVEIPLRTTTIGQDIQQEVKVMEKQSIFLDSGVSIETPVEFTLKIQV